MSHTFSLEQIAEIVAKGGVIAYPTEAVWGLGCDPKNTHAIERILALKDRPWQKGLVLVAADFSQLEPWLEPLSQEDLAKVQATWPGHVSWVLPCKPWVPACLKGEHSSLAVRVSAHPLVRALCAQTGPLVSTSANPATLEPARSQQEVEQYFKTGLDGILAGELGGKAQPSVIRTLDGQQLR